jgi:ABC-type nitrate/sulfonate/bicarbonate transport system permease component
MGATRKIDRNLLRLGDSLALNRWALLRKIIIPALIPTLATAARLAFGLTVIGLLLAGMISGTSGLGYELVSNIANVRMSRITGQVVFIIVLAIVPGFLLRYVEQRLTRRYSGE